MIYCKNFQGTIGENIPRIEPIKIKDYKVELLRRRINRVLKFMSTYPAIGWHNYLLRGLILCEVKQSGIENKESADYLYVRKKVDNIVNMLEEEEKQTDNYKEINTQFYKDFSDIENQRKWLRRIGVL